MLNGRVWLTRAHDLDDHFLDSGQAMQIDAGAQALLSAEGGPARLALLYAPAADAPGAPARPTMDGLQPAHQPDP